MQLASAARFTKGGGRGAEKPVRAAAGWGKRGGAALTRDPQDQASVPCAGPGAARCPRRGCASAPRPAQPHARPIKCPVHCAQPRRRQVPGETGAGHAAAWRVICCEYDSCPCRWL